MSHTRAKRKGVSRSRAFKTATHALSRRLRSWCEEEELTLSDVAEGIGVSIATVSAWEHATRLPSGEHLDRLAKYMNTPVCGLIYFGAGECPLCRRQTKKTRRR